jgi:hypothetical protein
MTTFPFYVPSGTTVYPETSGVQGLGTSEHPFGTAYLNSLVISGVTFNVSGVAFTGGALTSDITPTISGTLRVGTAALPFAEVNVKTLSGTTLVYDTATGTTTQTNTLRTNTINAAPASSSINIDATPGGGNLGISGTIVNVIGTGPIQVSGASFLSLYNTNIVLDSGKLVSAVPVYGPTFSGTVFSGDNFLGTSVLVSGSNSASVIGGPNGVTLRSSNGTLTSATSIGPANIEFDMPGGDYININSGETIFNMPLTRPLSDNVSDLGSSGIRWRNLKAVGVAATVISGNTINLSGNSVIVSGTNLGAAVGTIFSGKLGNDLRFNTVSGAGTVGVTLGGNVVIVSGSTSAAAALTIPASTTNNGLATWSGTTGAGLLSTTVTATGGTLSATTVSATTVSGATINATTSVSGAAIISAGSISGNSLTAPTISGATFIGMTLISGNTVVTSPLISGATIRASSVVVSPLISGTTAGGFRTMAIGNGIDAPVGDPLHLDQGTNQSVSMKFTAGSNTANGTRLGIDGQGNATLQVRDNNSLTLSTNDQARLIIANTGAITGTISLGIPIVSGNTVQVSGNNVIVSGTNLGAAVGTVFSGKLGNDLRFNTISGAGATSVSLAGNVIVVSGSVAAAVGIGAPASTTSSGIAIWSGTAGAGLLNSNVTIVNAGNTLLAPTLSGTTISGGAYTVGTSLSLVSGATFTPVISGSNVGGVTLGSIALPLSGVHAKAFIGDIAMLNFVIDGGGSVISSGSAGFIEIPYAASPISFDFLGNVSGNLSCDVRRTTYASWSGTGFATTASIVNTQKPNIASGTKAQNTNVNLWSGIAAGDILEFFVDQAPASITRASLAIKLRKIS